MQIGPRALRNVGGPSSLSRSGRNAAPSLSPLSPMAASQAPTAIYSMRKVNPAYAGNCLQGRNSANVLSTIGFAGNDVDDAAILAAMTAGDGVTYGAATWYDQSGNANVMASSFRPNVVRGAMARRFGAALPYLDFVANKNINLATTLTPIDFSAGKNVAVMVVYGTFGWGNNTAIASVRPAVQSAVYGSVLGFGTTAQGGMVYGAAGATGESSWGGATHPYLGATYADASAPGPTRMRAEWYNWKDGLLSGGGDGKIFYQNRPAAAPGGITGVQRLIVGNVGNLSSSHNGPVVEVIVFVSNTPLSDVECQRISLGQYQTYAVGDCARPTRYRLFGSGQSLIQYAGTVISASTGVATDNAVTRVMAPELATLLGLSTGVREMYFTANHYALCAVGGSSLLTLTNLTPDGPGATSWLAYDATDNTKKFWWDQYNDIPGPCAQLWKKNVLSAGAGNAVANANVVFDACAIIWDQGQADSTVIAANGETTNFSYAVYQAKNISLFAWMKAQFTGIGGIEPPILLQPIGRQNGYDAQSRAIRKVQGQVVAAMTKIHLLPETCHLTRQDVVHFGAGPADTNGFDRAAHQQNYAYLDIMQGTGQGTVRKWRGPYVASATKVGTNQIDLNIAWPVQGGGTDIAAQDGSTSGFVGFTVTDGSGVRTISAAIKQTVNTIRLTVSGAALSGTTTVQHDPTPTALDRNKMVVDNLSPVALPLKQAFDVIVDGVIVPPPMGHAPTYPYLGF